MGTSAEHVALVVEQSRTGPDVFRDVATQLRATAAATQQFNASQQRNAQAVRQATQEIERQRQATQGLQQTEETYEQTRRRWMAEARALPGGSGMASRTTPQQMVAESRAQAEATKNAAAAEAAHEAAVKRTTAAVVQKNAAMGGIPNARLRQGAQSISAIALAAQGAEVSARGAINAFGNLATTLAFVSQNAKFAAWAGWIGAAVVVAGTLASVMSKIGEKERERDERRFQRRLGDTDVHTNERLLAVLQKQSAEIERTQKATLGPLGQKTRRVDNWLEALIGVGRGEELEKLKRRIEEVRERGEALQEDAARAARERRRENLEELRLGEVRNRQHAALIGFEENRSEFDIQISQLDQARHEREMEIQRAVKEQRDAKGHILAATKEELDAMNALIESERVLFAERTKGVRRQQAEAQAEGTRRFMRESPLGGDRFAAELLEIQKLQAEEELLYDSTEIAAARASKRKIQLYRDVAKEGGKAFGQIHDAFINSSSRSLKAIAHVAESVRRFQIGAEAALAAVESARQFAKVPAALAAGNPFAAALHALSGTQLAAAAALGFREALGSGGGGGASGGAAATSATFEPDRGQAGSMTTVNLFTTDPFNSANIRRVAWLMNRDGVMGRPIYVPPTTGLSQWAA